MKVLIVTPNINLSGGVANLFKALKFNTNSSVDYLYLTEGSGRVKKVIHLIIFYRDFFKKIKFYDVVHVNPSLNLKSFLRDGVLVFIAKKIRHKKVLVYWHGWETSLENKVLKKFPYRSFFNMSFLKADKHIVLGQVFKDALILMKIKETKISLESNAAETSYLDSMSNIMQKSTLGQQVNILFISRILEDKGVLRVIDIFKNIQSKTSVPLSLNIAGDGPDLEEAKGHADSSNLSNIRFFGYIAGRDKHDLFLSSDILLFPTKYPEGMPLSILEAMLYGLPVIASTVGGIRDWISDQEHGFLFRNYEQGKYEDAILHLIQSPELYHKISTNCRTKAISQFTPESLKKRLLSYYKLL